MKEAVSKQSRMFEASPIVCLPQFPDICPTKIGSFHMVNILLPVE